MRANVTGGSAKDELAKARAPIGPHHQEVGIKVGGTRRDLVTKVDIGGNRGPHLLLAGLTIIIPRREDLFDPDQRSGLGGIAPECGGQVVFALLDRTMCERSADGALQGLIYAWGDLALIVSSACPRGLARDRQCHPHASSLR
jgi:hypothetical protein